MKMKRFKQFVSLLAATALCVLLPGISTLTAHAAEPVTYYVMYLKLHKYFHHMKNSFLVLIRLKLP